MLDSVLDLGLGEIRETGAFGRSSEDICKEYISLTGFGRQRRAAHSKNRAWRVRCCLFPFPVRILDRYRVINTFPLCPGVRKQRVRAIRLTFSVPAHSHGIRAPNCLEDSTLSEKTGHGGTITHFLGFGQSGDIFLARNLPVLQIMRRKNRRSHRILPVLCTSSRALGFLIGNSPKNLLSPHEACGLSLASSHDL